MLRLVQQFTRQDWSRPDRQGRQEVRARLQLHGKGQQALVLPLSASLPCRPLLLASVGKAARHANQTPLNLTPLHGRSGPLKRLITNIGAALQQVKAGSG